VRTSAQRSARIIGALIALGIIVRLVLYVANRPDNAYDDHWAPIETMLKQGRLPRVEDCWECGQPPLFYVLGVVVFKACRPFVDVPESLYSMQMLKAIQGISFVFGAATVVVAACIITTLFGYRRSALVGIGFMALLPRHVYLSAMLANDILSAFFTTLALFLVVRPPNDVLPSFRRVALVGFVAGLAALSKGTGLALIPGVAFWVAWWSLRAHSLNRFAKYAVVTLISFLVGGGWLYVWRTADYGNPFMKNMELEEFQFEQTESYEGLTSFVPRPVGLMRVPLLDQTTVSSLPTQLYARLWFDYEPYIVGNAEGLVPWARGAYLFGAIPSALIVLGFFWMGKRIRSNVAWGMLLAFFLTNLLLVVVHTITYRVYSAMKATYLLPSVAALACALSLGVRECLVRAVPRWRRVGDLLLTLAGVYFLAHIIWIVLSGPGHHGL
jgi:4-amino-4-deoxy-L-arabinose transferase-like glycosyltransferase